MLPRRVDCQSGLSRMSEACERKLISRGESAPRPAATLGPSTSASGIPSISVPAAMANPLPGMSASDGCWTQSPQRVRSCAPRCESPQLTPLKSAAPARSSSDSSATRNAAPKGRHRAIARCENRPNVAANARHDQPRRREDPQRPAASQVGSSCIRERRVPGGAPWPARAGGRTGRARTAARPRRWRARG